MDGGAKSGAGGARGATFSTTDDAQPSLVVEEAAVPPIVEAASAAAWKHFFLELERLEWNWKALSWSPPSSSSGGFRPLAAAEARVTPFILPALEALRDSLLFAPITPESAHRRLEKKHVLKLLNIPEFTMYKELNGGGGGGGGGAAQHPNCCRALDFVFAEGGLVETTLDVKWRPVAKALGKSSKLSERALTKTDSGGVGAMSGFIHNSTTELLVPADFSQAAAVAQRHPTVNAETVTRRILERHTHRQNINRIEVEESRP